MSSVTIHEAIDSLSFKPGQRVNTSFGPGTVSAFSKIDAIVYVTLGDKKAGLYLLRPEQVESVDGELFAGFDE